RSAERTATGHRAQRIALGPEKPAVRKKTSKDPNPEESVAEEAPEKALKKKTPVKKAAAKKIPTPRVQEKPEE
ncbi:MAG: hypothetical protein LBD54_01820, partial [Puniceicoccales bacterium]|nr:hypothetical protein [Puniceicoccales bacterium]